MISNPAERLAEYNFKSGETPGGINKKIRRAKNMLCGFIISQRYP